MYPIWIASYTAGLANHMGFNEEYIWWELPVARGLQYQHVITMANGAKTVAATESGEMEFKKLMEQARGK